MSFYLTQFEPEVMVSTGSEPEVGDEGLARWHGYLAGPFDTFEQAEVALAAHKGGRVPKLAIYDDAEQMMYVPSESA